MYGDDHFILIKSGSTAASADTAHLFFGSYGGLSDLNNGEVLHIQTMPVGGEARIGDDNTVSNDIGYAVFPTASYVDLPAIRVGLASRLHFVNKLTGTDVTVDWTIWRRSPPIR